MKCEVVSLKEGKNEHPSTVLGEGMPGGLLEGSWAGVVEQVCETV